MRDRVNTAWTAFRCPPLSKTTWEREARRKGMSFSEWARAVLDAAAKK